MNMNSGIVRFVLKIKLESGEWFYNGSMWAYNPVEELDRAKFFRQLSDIRQHPISTMDLVEDHDIVRVRLKELDSIL